MSGIFKRHSISCLIFSTHTEVLTFIFQAICYLVTIAFGVSEAVRVYSLTGELAGFNNFGDSLLKSNDGYFASLKGIGSTVGGFGPVTFPDMGPVIPVKMGGSLASVQRNVGAGGRSLSLLGGAGNFGLFGSGSAYGGLFTGLTGSVGGIYRFYA